MYYHFLVSYKSLDGEKTSPKIMSEILTYFHEICLRVFFFFVFFVFLFVFLNNFKCSPCKFHTK